MIDLFHASKDDYEKLMKFIANSNKQLNEVVKNQAKGFKKVFENRLTANK